MRAIAVAMLAALVGCAGQSHYVRPESQQRAEPWTKIVPKSRDAVWDATIPVLASKFFVINTMDRTSGIIGISFSGDPEKYLDCGQITVEAGGVNSGTVFQFPGARAQQRYMLFEPFKGNFVYDRSLSMQGRVNLIFEVAAPDSTRVTAAVRFIVTRQNNITNATGATFFTNHSIAFNSGQVEAFPSTGRDAVACLSTGALERELLDAVR